MAIPATTDSRDFSSRDLAYTAEAVLFDGGVRDNVNVHSPTAGIFLARQSAPAFGGTRLEGSARRTQVGGERIRTQHRLGRSTNRKRLSSAWDSVNTNPQNNLRPSLASWAHYSTSVVMSFTDELVNAGGSQITDIVADQTEAEFLDLTDLIVEDIIVSGGNDAVNSINELVSANDAIDGLSGADHTTWNARGLSARGTAPASVSFAATGAAAVTLLSDMRTAWLNCTEGTEQPTVGLTGQTVFGLYEGRLQAQERYTNTTMADAGFVNLAFKTAPIMADSKYEEKASGRLDFINTRRTYAVFLAGADFNMREAHEAQNQEATAAKMLAKLQIVTEDRRLNNKITGIA